MAKVILTHNQIIKAITEYIANHDLLPADGRTVVFKWGMHDGELMVEVKEKEDG